MALGGFVSMFGFTDEAHGMGEQAEKHWYMEFVVKDWLCDPQLSLCKEATRGIWIDALCSMHMQDRCGQLVGTIQDLAKLCRTTPNAMRLAVDDLKTRKAAPVTESHGIVTLKNTRMRTAYEIRVKAVSRKRKQRGLPECPGDVTEDVTPPVTGHTNSHTQNHPNLSTPIAPEGFDRFWKSWPAHHRKEERKACLKKWGALGCEPIVEQILSRLDAWKKSEIWIKDSGQFICAPLVWLNKKRWEILAPPPENGNTTKTTAQQNAARVIERMKVNQ